MKLSLALKKPALAFAALVASGAALASEIATDDTFYTFYDTITGWTSGGLGVGLATTMLLMGGVVGVAKNNPMPALAGIAGAAFLHWGPDIIEQIMIGGTLI
jgi:conjugal transfer pilus assembly protein TraA